MAKNKSIIKLNGTLGELTFYQSGGEALVKQKTSLNGNKIKTDPKFQRTRENNQEFGGAAMIAKAFRSGFVGISKGITDKEWYQNCQKGYLKAIKLGPGSRGQRAYEVNNAPNIFNGLNFNATNHYDSIMLAPSSFTVNPDRNQVTWNIPDFNIIDYVNAPIGATHLRFVLAIATLSGYTYQNSEGIYMPNVPQQNEQSAFSWSNYLPINAQSGTIDINTDLNLGAALDPNVALNVATGIVFYQEGNNTMYELSSANAMKIAQVVV